MSLTLPAGQVFSAAFTYRQTRRWGASPVVASWQLAISGVIAASGLALLGVAGALLVGGSVNTFTLVVPIAGVLAIVFAVRYVSAHPSSIRSAAGWVLGKINNFRNQAPDIGRERVDAIIEQVRFVRLGPRDAGLTLTWSVVHRLADVACLGFACYAVGADPRLSGLLFAFAAAKAVGSVPLAPRWTRRRRRHPHRTAHQRCLDQRVPGCGSRLRLPRYQFHPRRHRRVDRVSGALPQAPARGSGLRLRTPTARNQRTARLPQRRRAARRQGRPRNCLKVAVSVARLFRSECHSRSL